MFNMPTYKIIATCIECTIECAMAAQRMGISRLRCALLFTIDKLMSGFSLVGKVFEEAQC